MVDKEIKNEEETEYLFLEISEIFSYAEIKQLGEYKNSLQKYVEEQEWIKMEKEEKKNLIWDLIEKLENLNSENKIVTEALLYLAINKSYSLQQTLDVVDLMIQANLFKSLLNLFVTASK